MRRSVATLQLKKGCPDYLQHRPLNYILFFERIAQFRIQSHSHSRMHTSVDISPAMSNLQYLEGFGNHFATEALPDALPKGQNNPQKCPYGLYAEQLSGTAFTAPRHKNLRSWLYRIRPSVIHDQFVPLPHEGLSKHDSLRVDPNQFRWAPFEFPSSEAMDFVDGLSMLCGAGDPSLKEGVSMYVYFANVSMQNRAMYNSDGDYLIVPQLGALTVRTEMGILHVEPCEIIVIPRGIKFSIEVEGPSRGYILEIFKGHFELPTLGPIGANGLANPRDFKAPVAAYEDRDVEHYRLVNKFQGELFTCLMDHSPFDVVAWHGNYNPYKYDLRLFCTMNSVSFDHPVCHPSISTFCFAYVSCRIHPYTLC